LQGDIGLFAAIAAIDPKEQPRRKHKALHGSSGLLGRHLSENLNVPARQTSERYTTITFAYRLATCVRGVWALPDIVAGVCGRYAPPTMAAGVCGWS